MSCATIIAMVPDDELAIIENMLTGVTPVSMYALLLLTGIIPTNVIIRWLTTTTSMILYYYGRLVSLAIVIITASKLLKPYQTRLPSSSSQQRKLQQETLILINPCLQSVCVPLWDKVILFSSCILLSSNGTGQAWISLLTLNIMKNSYIIAIMIIILV